MDGDKRFNVRVYGIWIKDGKLLVNEELIKGQKVIKLPGGGLEFGEGTIECLQREWKEELDLEIEVTGHFYTTDYFQPSAFGESQVISIYYTVQAPDAPELLKNLFPGERAYWMDMALVDEATFTLPIDKLVGGMLKKQYSDTL